MKGFRPVSTNKVKSAPINKRMFAYGLDWYFGWVFTILPIAYYWNVKTGEMAINYDISKFNGNDAYIAGLLGIGFSIIYFFIVPLCNQGQTFGKKLLKIAIKDENGEPLKWQLLAVRQIIFVMIVESSFMFSGNLVCQMLGIAISPLIGQLLSYAMMICFVISLFTTIKYRKAIHDYVVKSIVVETK